MEITGIISGLIIGIVIGALGRLVLPGRQRIPIWLTILIGVIAALVGTAIAAALGVADTRGVDWIEFGIQIALAALGVSLAVGLYGGKRRRE
ncbi:GlsB/YeaQ/YmgE family stress response membrane protein [Nonomuraea sp. NPDC049695]|uniref:GlsB/YeaQ/YmgE family stress response membrane protein n=1 Tax=Nonomuraea sp. NPDC049695 TaxID=3154734 RepID=UPI003430B9AC